MSSPSCSSRNSLTRQQRNLALAEPIARLSRERRIIFKDDPNISDRLDVQCLALSAIDFVMERSAIEPGAPPRDIVDHVAVEAARMKPALTEEQGRKVAIAYGGGNAFRQGAGNLDDLIARTEACGAMYLGDLDPAGIRILLGVNRRRRAEGRPPLQLHRGLYRWLLAYGRRCPFDGAQGDGLADGIDDLIPADIANGLIDLWSAGERIPQESFGLGQLRGEEAAVAAPDAA